MNDLLNENGHDAVSYVDAGRLEAPCKRQFSLTNVFVVVLVYAFSLALAICFSLQTMQIIAAISVLTLFVGLDLWFHRREQLATPKLAALLIFLARYATALSFSTIACLVVFLLTLESQISTPTQASGVAAAFEPLVRVIVLVFAYVGVFSAFSILAFMASLLVIRRFRMARWLALINLPGTALFCFFIIGLCFGDWGVSPASSARPQSGHLVIVETEGNITRP